MNEEEIIDKLTEPKKYPLIEIIRKFKRDGIENYIITKSELIQGLLDLYNKEKEKNKELEERDRANRKVIREYSDCIPKSKVRELIEKYRCFGWHNKDDEYWANRILDGFEELLQEGDK